MATVSPFKGVLYNPEMIDNPGDVCTPPYDVISEEERRYFYERHDNNVVRLILGPSLPTDTDLNNAHSRAAKYFNDWIEHGVLVQDHAPAVYLTSVEFPVETQSVIRYGIIARVRLEPFEKKIILPHEKTFSKVKSERLDLMKKCHVNFSPVFAIYPDDTNTILDRLKAHVSQQRPDMDFSDHQGLQHRMWRVVDNEIHRYVENAMRNKKLYIADGHHRYETALNYRNWRAEQDAGFSESHPANHVMMYMSCMDEPGLTILPAHRLLTGIGDIDVSSFLRKAEDYFDIIDFPFGGGTEASAQAAFQKTLKARHSSHAVGVCIRNIPHGYLLIAKDGIMDSLFPEMPDCLRRLDVTVLTHLVFMNLLGFESEHLDDEKRIRYTSNTETALAAVQSGACDAAFILNHTKIEHVKEVAENGLIMPGKSTYFYPKVITGQVMYKLY
ncbi:MAG: DUF1015 domain-containing protein [Desulfobacterales bacterium]